jgi:hypothetical protein
MPAYRRSISLTGVVNMMDARSQPPHIWQLPRCCPRSFDRNWPNILFQAMVKAMPRRLCPVMRRIVRARLRPSSESLIGVFARRKLAH